MKTANKLVSIVCICVLMAGCAAKHAPVNGITAPTTALEQINSDNAQIAVHNRAIAESIIAINQAGFLETGYFGTISGLQIQATRIHQQLTPLVATPTAANLASIQSLLNQLNATADQMISNGTAGIKNAQSQQNFISEANALKSLVSTILSSLQVAGVIKQ